MRGTALCVIALIVFGSIFSFAQVTTGTISGTISDSSGAVLPGAKVDITNEGTGVVRSVNTDAAGHYSAPVLPVGNYKISANVTGFDTEVRSGIELTIGREAVVDMKLQVGAVSQSVEVTGEAPLVQTTEATVSYLTSDQTMRDLPLNDRDMSKLILLNPGVTETETAGGSVLNGYGRRISISGARGEDNTYLLDGGMIGDYLRHIPAGPSGAFLGLESVQEFQVLTNGFSSQYGRALGGVFNSVSKSGTNSFHGDAYEYIRNDIVDATTWENNSFNQGVKLPFRRNQFGATAGGPIKRDKVFFFAGYEGTRERLASTVTQQTFDDNARKGIFPVGAGGQVPVVSPLMLPYVDWYPRATPGARNFNDGTQYLVSSYSQPTTEDYGQGRIDVPTLTNSDSMFFRYTQSVSSRDSRAGFPGFIQTSYLSTKLLALSETHIYSPTLLNTVRVFFSRIIPVDDGREPPPCAVNANAANCVPVGVFYTPGQKDSPQLTPGTVASIGGGGFATKPTVMTTNRYTYQDDANWTKGPHSLQFGGLVERFQYNNTRSSREFGVWTWPSLQYFLAGTCGNLNGLAAQGACAAPGATPDTTTESNFRGTPPGSGAIYPRGFRMWFLAGYLQDNWRVNKKLNLNVGVRWEPYTVPTEVNNLISNMKSIFFPNVGYVGSPYWLNKSWTDFSPRLGFAYDPFGTGKTSLRGAFALLYEPNDPNEWYNQMNKMPPLSYDFNIPGTGHFPFDLTEVQAQNSKGAAFAVEYGNNRDSHMMQYNLTLQQQIGSSDLFSIGYVGSRGNDLPGLLQYGTPFAFWDGVSLAVPTPAVVANPNFSEIDYFGPWADSWYNSLQVSYHRRFSKGLQTQVSYTYGRSISTADQAQTSNPVNTSSSAGKYAWDTHSDKAVSGYNVSNSLVLNYSYDLPSVHGMNRIISNALSGWQTTGLLTVHSGHPGSVTVGIPTALSNVGVPSRFPNSVPNFSGPVVLGTPSDGQLKYFNSAAFQYNPATGLAANELGNLGRDTLIGPGLVTWDPGIFKTFAATERVKVQFRAEMFNVLNHPNYSFPSTSLTNATGTLSGSVGTISTTVGSPRQIQFALKLIF